MTHGQLANQVPIAQMEERRTQSYEKKKEDRRVLSSICSSLHNFQELIEDIDAGGSKWNIFERPNVPSIIFDLKSDIKMYDGISEMCQSGRAHPMIPVMTFMTHKILTNQVSVAQRVEHRTYL
ncbi:hypothetical protein HDV06_002941 [Boothiomyces sp. JEL0866]|nr:hypothetical protein HDV06_002941 [Boothiomyces sp. JEL0866]